MKVRYHKCKGIEGRCKDLHAAWEAERKVLSKLKETDVEKMNAQRQKVRKAYRAYRRCVVRCLFDGETTDRKTNELTGKESDATTNASESDAQADAQAHAEQVELTITEGQVEGPQCEQMEEAVRGNAPVVKQLTIDIIDASSSSTAAPGLAACESVSFMERLDERSLGAIYGFVKGLSCVGDCVLCGCAAGGIVAAGAAAAAVVAAAAAGGIACLAAYVPCVCLKECATSCESVGDGNSTGEECGKCCYECGACCAGCGGCCVACGACCEGCDGCCDGCGGCDC